MTNKAKITFQDVHFTRAFRDRFISSMSDDIRQAVICSPYFDKLPVPFSDVSGFCAFLQRRGTEDIQIITRPPGKDRQALSLDMAKRLASQDIEIYIRPTPFLHAKLYHFEYRKGYFRTFVGSSNFTLGGLVNNHELMMEIEGVGNGSPCHREIARMQANNTVTYTAWIARGQPAGSEEEK